MTCNQLWMDWMLIFYQIPDSNYFADNIKLHPKFPVLFHQVKVQYIEL